MSDRLEIQPVGRLHATVRPPGSKSITNRALVCAALAQGSSTLHGALDSDDTRVMVVALRQLGVVVQVDPASRSLAVSGCGGSFPVAQGDFFIGNSGTSVRFLTSMLTLGHGTYRLDGTTRMRERPIGDLLEGLSQLGANVTSEAGNGCPPVVVRAAGLLGGTARVRGDVSSQFLSGLLLAAPYANREVELIVEGKLVSKPYVHMTLAIMESFGVAVADGDLTRFTIPRGTYGGREYEIEPDASAASYFFGAAAIAGGEITVEGLSRSSLQGDVAFVEVLEKMGCQVRYDAHAITVTGPRELRGVDVDMNGISDTVQTLAAVAVFAEGPTTVTGVGHIRHKETDRIAALAAELRKFGAVVHERPDGLRIEPRPLHGAGIDTYDDHRMAMSLALVGLRVPGVVIHDPGCTSKTYPEFFRDLAALSSR